MTTAGEPAARAWCARSRRPCAGRSRWSASSPAGSRPSSRSARARCSRGSIKKIAKDARVLNVEDPASLEQDRAPPSRRRGRRRWRKALWQARSSLVTGASRGIGRGHRAGARGRGGHRGAAAPATRRSSAEAVGAIAAAGGRAEAVALDVASRASVDAAFATLLAGPRAARRPREQRRHHPRQPAPAHEGRGVGRGARHQPDRGLPLHPGGAASPC